MAPRSTRRLGSLALLLSAAVLAACGLSTMGTDEAGDDVGASGADGSTTDAQNVLGADGAGQPIPNMSDSAALDDGNMMMDDPEGGPPPPPPPPPDAGADAGDAGPHPVLDAGDASTTMGCAAAAGIQVQSFGNGMWGCGGAVYHAQAKTLCAPGLHICSASEWMSKRGTATPARHYWTSDALRYGGDQDHCWVSLTNGSVCSNSVDEPMRVCKSVSKDDYGNYCNWQNCGYGSSTTNEYFGGCQKDYTSGALCCE